MASRAISVFSFVLLALIDCFLCKECTNVPSQLSSHTLRYELLSSTNKSWQETMFSSYNNLTPSNDSVQSSPRPYRMVRQRQERVLLPAEKEFINGDGFLHDISLHKVRLDADSAYGESQKTNLEYLLMLDVDSLVWSFRKTAGLVTPGSPYGSWEGPDCELRGHFVGHYMSASALMWASTHNKKLQCKMQAVVNALYECQRKLGTGYLSAFPSELFDRFEAIQPVWAPYYTIHKIMAGLLDQYKLAGNAQAFKMVIWMADYFYNRVQNVISKYTIERHWRSLNEETGGMNDVLYQLYLLSGKQEHLRLAHLFDKPCFLGLLAVQADSLSGFHANTHIPVVIGSQMRFEITGDPLYKEISTYFMGIVNSSHSYATGGTSAGEFWSDPKRLASTLGTENAESCTAYNMLKVTRHLFCWTKEMAYADYYERVLINGVLTIQRGSDPGVMIYMLPLGPGKSKSVSYHGWGTPFDSFWCCYGTGIESFSKLGDSIYFLEGGKFPTLYVIQFISSTLTWDKAGLILKQTIGPLSALDPYLRVSVEFFKLKALKKHSMKSTLKIRIPYWTTADGAQAILNDHKLSLPEPGNFLIITKEWERRDKLSLLLPVRIRTETIKDDRPQFMSLQAFLFGPYLLAGMSHGDWDLSMKKTKLSSESVTAVPHSFSSQLFSFCQEGKIPSSLELDNSTLVFTLSNNGILMDPVPGIGQSPKSSETKKESKSHSSSRNSRKRSPLGTVCEESTELGRTPVSEHSLGVEWARQRLPVPVQWLLSPLSTSIVEQPSAFLINNVLLDNANSTDRVFNTVRSGLFFLHGLEVIFSSCNSFHSSPILCIPLVKKIHILSVVFVNGGDLFLETPVRKLLGALQELYGHALDRQSGASSVLMSQRGKSEKSTTPQGCKDYVLDQNDRGKSVKGVTLSTLNFERDIDDSYQTFIDTLIQHFAATSFGDVVYGRQVTIYLHRGVEASIRLATWNALANDHILELLPPLDQCFAHPKGYLFPPEDHEKMIEAYVSSWVSGALDKAAARMSLTFSLALHHIASFIFIGDKLSMRKKVARNLLLDSSRKPDHQVKMSQLLKYNALDHFQEHGNFRDGQVLSGEELTKRSNFLLESCEGDSLLLAEVLKIQTAV